MDKLLRKEIIDLKPYVPNNYEYKYKMDANESPFNLSKNILNDISDSLQNIYMNRYPDTNSTELRKMISNFIEVEKDNIVVGNGSNELINIILTTFINKGDIVISHSPTFSMYKIASKIFGARYLDIESDNNFNININSIIENANKKNAKLIIICNPNNPTGKAITRKEIFRILDETKGIVLVDEAYIEFGEDSVVNEINNYQRLIVLRTLSKAFGLAGIRTGYLVGGEKIVNKINSVKPPYNLNVISQCIAINVLKNLSEIRMKINEIKEERNRLYTLLNNTKNIKVFSSKANFILIEVNNAQKVFDHLLKKGILVRKFSNNRLNNNLRITIGSKKENDILIKAIEEVV